MDPFNALSTAAAARKIPSLKEAPPTKVISCALVTSTELEKNLDATRDVTGGAGTPMVKMAGHPWFVAIRATVRRAGHHQRAKIPLVPEVMERAQLMVFPLVVTPTSPTTGILTPRKVNARRQLEVPSSSSDDDLSLVKHDAWVDLNPGSMRVRYTQEHVVVSDSPPPSPSHYIMSGQRVGAGYSKVLIPNPDYKGKGHTKSASSNQTLRVQRCRPPPKICGPPKTMEFTDDDMEEKEELSNELVASLKQKITALEEQITELHLAVYDQQDDFGGVLHKATTSKLKCFAKALGTPSSTMLHLHRVALEKFGNNLKALGLDHALVV
jgi:hypothetical protein